MSNTSSEMVPKVKMFSVSAAHSLKFLIYAVTYFVFLLIFHYTRVEAHTEPKLGNITTSDQHMRRT